MATSSSRLVIAGLSGDSGKTIASLSFLTALKRKGLSVSVFKKGPDYIDPAWLSISAQTACRNLDTFMVDANVVRRTFLVHSDGADIAVIEGNRGLFDGRDAAGTNSTAELAKLLAAPVVLVVNTAKTTRTVAALVKGCLEFDPDVDISGVILNRVAGTRHSKVARESIEKYCGIRVLGAIPNLGDDSVLIPGRHLGLITPAEFGAGAGAGGLLSRLGKIADEYLDVDAMIETACGARPLHGERPEAPGDAEKRVEVGYFRDSVFTFYYPENLEALERHGARLVPVSSLADRALPDVDALYIGGGFPETHAAQLADNGAMMNSVKAAAQNGMPVYAECGGLIYLSRSVESDNNIYPMAGLFPIELKMFSKPVGHGYAILEVDKPNPFYRVGSKIRGHEFHYSGTAGEPIQIDSCFKVETGVGVGNNRDGLVCGNTLACYTHVHADGVQDWASSIIRKAVEYKKTKADGRDGHKGVINN